MAALVLLVLRYNDMISSSGVLICLVAWMVKDWVMYPWLKVAYEASLPTDSRALIGSTGVAEGDLAPQGFVRVRGELWQGVATPSDAPISAGTKIEILHADGMTVFVRPCSEN